MKRTVAINRAIIFAALLVVSCLNLPAQELLITDVEIRGGDVVITYNLVDQDIHRKYSVYLYTSRDNFIEPMTEVEGNVGVDQSIGSNKQLIWHVRREFGNDYQSDIALELKGNIYVPFVNITDFGDDRIIKRSTQFDFTWAGGRGDNVLTIELFKGNERVHVFSEEPATTGLTPLTIPSKMKPGTDYRIKVSDKRNRDEIVYTSSFEVKRKIPQAYKIVGSFILGGLTAILIDSIIPEPDIPEPPLPNGG